MDGRNDRFVLDVWMHEHPVRRAEQPPERTIMEKKMVMFGKVAFRTSRRNVGLHLRRCSGPGPHLGMTSEPRAFARIAAGVSSFDGEFRFPPVLAHGSPIFHSSFEGELGSHSSHCGAK